ncbi:uncharacterized protein OCT59_006430 [Rhizophagus irregularis]|uniref:uncharacterized protein n=1 Tax=Rhizophagus irregularis TaxID=588596 RepID=UPI001D245748|nr:hypothetical protein OCT59_006430 [Rhizophagus irregularis]CAG8640231.1 13681_t:CDS:2 [Rhizophagus irregularis]
MPEQCKNDYIKKDKPVVEKGKNHWEEKEVRLTKLITMIMIIKHQINCFINLNEDDIKQLEIKEDEEVDFYQWNSFNKYHFTKSMDNSSTITCIIGKIEWYKYPNLKELKEGILKGSFHNESSITYSGSKYLC